MYVDINTYMDTRDHDSNVAGQPNIEPTPLLSGKTTAVTDITEHDILLGRGKSNANHIGNVLFQGKASMTICSTLYVVRINCEPY